MSPASAEYQLAVELPAGWTVLDAAQLRSSVGRLITGPLAAAAGNDAGEAGSVPNLVASIVLSIDSIAEGVTSIFVASMVVEVVAADGELPKDQPAFSSARVDDVSVASGVSCPMVVSTVVIASDDGHACAVVTFSSPNVAQREELEAGFAGMASKVHLRRKEDPPIGMGAGGASGQEAVR